MKILCVCNYGNVRSVALKNSFRMLNKNGIKYDALNVGLLCTSKETLKYLIDWADLIIDLADENLKEREIFYSLEKDRYVREDIGGDRWHDAFDEELKEIVKKIRNKYRNDNQSQQTKPIKGSDSPEQQTGAHLGLSLVKDKTADSLRGKGLCKNCGRELEEHKMYRMSDVPYCYKFEPSESEKNEVRG